VNDLQGHSRSSELPLLNGPYTTSYFSGLQLQRRTTLNTGVETDTILGELVVVANGVAI